MKKIILVLFYLIANIISGQEKQANITGTWSYETSYTDLSIDITQKKSSIEGNICSFMQNGNRIDCGDNNNLKGLISNNIIHCVFQSFYGGGTGKATITILPDGKLKWEITQKPKGEYYIPDKAVLNKSL